MKTISTCFEHNIFHDDRKDIIYGQVYGLFLKILQVATRTGIHHRVFCGTILSQKISWNCLWWSYFLIRPFFLFFILRRYTMFIWKFTIVAYRAIVYSQHFHKLRHILLWGYVEIAAQKTFENIQKDVCSRVPFCYNCMNAVYGLLPIRKLSYIYFSWRAQKGKDFLKFQKPLKKTLQNSSYSLTLQTCNPELLTSVKKDPKKNISFECSEIVCHKRVHNKVIWLK